MTTSVPAWLIVAGDKTFALAEKEMIEYIIEPDCMTVPVTPVYSSNVIIWREQLIPVFDLCVLMGMPPISKVTSLVVVAYQVQALEPLNYVALVISGSPVRIEVVDEQACEAPEDNHPLLSLVAMGYFMRDDEPISILDLKILCATDFIHKARPFSSRDATKTA